MSGVICWWYNLQLVIQGEICHRNGVVRTIGVWLREGKKVNVSALITQVIVPPQHKLFFRNNILNTLPKRHASLTTQWLTKIFSVNDPGDEEMTSNQVHQALCCVNYKQQGWSFILVQTFQLKPFSIVCCLLFFSHYNAQTKFNEVQQPWCQFVSIHEIILISNQNAFGIKTNHISFWLLPYFCHWSNNNYHW